MCADGEYIDKATLELSQRIGEHVEGIIHKADTPVFQHINAKNNSDLYQIYRYQVSEMVREHRRCGQKSTARKKKSQWIFYFI